jgi:hypothetical protein
MREVSWVADELLASQEGLHSPTQWSKVEASLQVTLTTIHTHFFSVVKGPAADATDAPQP